MGPGPGWQPPELRRRAAEPDSELRAGGPEPPGRHGPRQPSLTVVEDAPKAMIKTRTRRFKLSRTPARELGTFNISNFQVQILGQLQVLAPALPI